MVDAGVRAALGRGRGWERSAGQEPGAGSREPGSRGSDGGSGKWGTTRYGSVKCEGFVYIYTDGCKDWSTSGAGAGVVGNVRGLYFYILGKWEM
jgi:hypothetical protein